MSVKRVPSTCTAFIRNPSEMPDTSEPVWISWGTEMA